MLKTEILATRSKLQPWANQEENQFPDLPPNHYIYLGMVFTRHTDKIMLRPRALLLKTKLKGRADIAIRNMKELESFLPTDKFQKSHLAALVHGLYNPQTTLIAIYSNVAHLIMRFIFMNSPNFETWTS